VLLCIAVPFLYKWFINPIYSSGIQYVVWNAFAFFFWGLYALLLGILYYYKKNSLVIMLSVFTSVVCIVLNVVLIKQYGIIGAAWANFITYAALFIAIVITVIRTCKLQLPWLHFSRIFKKQV
jgi:O-antigen/teichoic acid export membrane protein